MTPTSRTYHESFRSGYLADGIVRLVEAPFSLATVDGRDGSVPIHRNAAASAI
ncbi:MAG: hypothetical protein U0183_16305 [Polyangiaceae bacterium]